MQVYSAAFGFIILPVLLVLGIGAFIAHGYGAF
jgi:hypothetical protein